MKQKAKQGQILILMSLMSTTLVILFGFVVGIGHLVQTKINLQNAVDLAAMAGASVQARYLNKIAAVNYRVRQNYKFVLYDLYVTQSRFNQGFHDDVLGGTASPFTKVANNGGYSFAVCQQCCGFENFLPYGGRAFDQNTDLCRQVRPAGVIPDLQTVPPGFSGNVLLEELRDVTEDARDAFERLCAESGPQNSEYFTYITDRLSSRNNFQKTQLEAIFSAFGGVFNGGTDILSSAAPGDEVIRQTFLDNLIGASQDGVVSIEHINNSGSRMIDGAGGIGDYFDEVNTRFSQWAINWNYTQGTGCSPDVVADTSPLIYMGVARSRLADNKPRTAFNIILKAKVTPKLLFWPQSLTPELTVVAAAKPFGARIAAPKSITEDELGIAAGSGGANMNFYPGDNTGIFSKFLLQKLYARTSGHNGVVSLRPQLTGPGGCINNPSFSCMAQAPTLYEALFWSPFPIGNRDIDSDQSLVNSIPSLGGLPIDGSLAVSEFDGNYDLPDRGFGASGGWHTVPIIESAEFSQGSNPLFFANRAAMASSWSPDVDVNSLSGAGTDIKGGRMGYQIKLLSLSQACAETGSLNGVLQRYCEAGQGVLH